MSGLRAAAKAVQVSADNIVNARDHIRVEDMPVSAVVKAQKNGNATDPPFEGFRPHVVQNVSIEGGGVKAVVREVDPAYVEAFVPGDPAANDNGLVGRPNVDIATELVRMQQAKHLYMANLKAFETENEMLGALVNDRV